VSDAGELPFSADPLQVNPDLVDTTVITDLS
jgi:hypothetical protein